MPIGDNIKNAHKNLIVSGSGNTGEKVYKILENFKNTYIEKDMQKEEKMINPIFRVFETVKPERGRKLNVDPQHGFDPYSDSLMDYPSIIAHKLKKPWPLFNRQISTHLPFCPNDCWHCFLPKELYTERDKRSKKVTAAYIVEEFIKQKDTDAPGKHSNVLRITGGEPFLVPGLILECLEKIKEKSLQNDIFLWTETNLEPFMGKDGEAFMDQSDKKVILAKLKEFNNFAVHPCFHGFKGAEFDCITGKDYDREYDVTMELQINALKRLVDAGIDIYPTFGSNVCNPGNIVELFLNLKGIHDNLPLRVALVKYYLGYPPIELRVKQRDGNRSPDLYSHSATLRIWNQLLLDNYGFGYGVMPRHLVKLEKDQEGNPIKMSEISEDYGEYGTKETHPIKYEKEIIYMFKGSFRASYHQETLENIALPEGHISKIEYDKKYVPEDLYFHMSQLSMKYLNRQAVWVYVYKDRDTYMLTPYREATIIDISEGGGILTIKYKLGRYFFWEDAHPMDITQALKKYFGPKEIPPGGKYLLLGETIMKTDDDSSQSADIKFSNAFCHEEGKLDSGSSLNEFRKVVKTFNPATPMKKSLFYRVTNDSPDNSTKLEMEKLDNRTIYKIKGGEGFQLNFEYFLPNYGEFDEKNAEERTIYFEVSSNEISPIGLPKIVLSKYGSQQLHFRTAIVTEKKEVTLTFYSKDDPFNAAKVEINILLIPPSRAKQALKALFGAVFLILVTNSLALASKSTSTPTNAWESLVIGAKNLLCSPSGGIKILNILFILFVAGVIFIYFFFFPNGEQKLTKLK